MRGEGPAACKETKGGKGHPCLPSHRLMRQPTLLSTHLTAHTPILTTPSPPYSSPRPAVASGPATSFRAAAAAAPPSSSSSAPGRVDRSRSKQQDHSRCEEELHELQGLQEERGARAGEVS